MNKIKKKIQQNKINIVDGMNGNKMTKTEKQKQKKIQQNKINKIKKQKNKINK